MFARGHHAVGRQWVLVPFGRGDAADDRHDRIAVEEDFLDVVIEIEKRLPVQGGLGGASGNAVAALLALEKALGKELSPAERLRITA